VQLKSNIKVFCQTLSGVTSPWLWYNCVVTKQLLVYMCIHHKH